MSIPESGIAGPYEVSTGPDDHDDVREACPECFAEPNQSCEPYCTSGDAGTSGRDGHVRIGRDKFAVRDCPRCAGSGRDRYAPSDDCRCVVDVVVMLELCAAKLLDEALWEVLAQGPETDRLTEGARRYRAHALAAALRAQNVPARVHPYSGHGCAVALDTRFGTLFAVRPIAFDDQVLIQRTDATEWTLHAPGDPAMIAARLKTTVPELTEPSERGDRLHWAVAAIPRNPGGLYGPAPELVWHGVEAQPGQACVHCVAFGVLGTCPGLHHHMTRAVRRLREDGRKVVFGAFPVPVDADPHGPATTDALRRALRTAALDVWVNRLSIT